MVHGGLLASDAAHRDLPGGTRLRHGVTPGPRAPSACWPFVPLNCR